MSSTSNRRPESSASSASLRERIRSLTGWLLALMLAATACAPEADTGQLEPPASDPGKQLQSLYVPMRDGVRIAIDLWLPEDFAPGGQVPTLMTMTRYWRAQDRVDASLENDSNWAVASRVGDAGYAYVLVDARGTGASFGSRDYVTTEDEVRDYGEIAQWIVDQPWSNGRVGSFGVSYGGTTAEMLAVNGHPAVRAVAPLYPDFDAFDHLIFPGNVFLEFFTDDWGQAVRSMDQNDVCALRGQTGDACQELLAQVRGVKPVDADVDGSLLRAAVREHAENVRVDDAARAMEFHDDPFGDATDVERRSTPAFHVEEIEASGVAIFSRVGWLDAATTNGALSRFRTLSNRQRVVIGALSHGGNFDTDPFDPVDAEPDPSREAQFEELFAFFDAHLKDDATGDFPTGIRYATFGSDEWRETAAWPPEGFTETLFYTAPDGRLETTAPVTDAGADTYTVDYSATSGRQTRWHTNIGGGDVVYPDRRDEDEKLVHWTSAPFERPVVVTGHPLLTLHLAASHKDGALFAYLESVAPDGRVTYLTEGQLRLASRIVADEEPPYHHFGPYRTLERRHALPMAPGRTTEITLDLWAVSARIEAGHRVRLALAGADDGNFARYPLGKERRDPPPTWTIERHTGAASRIVLPIRKLDE